MLHTPAPCYPCSGPGADDECPASRKCWAHVQCIGEQIYCGDDGHDGKCKAWSPFKNWPPLQPAPPAPPPSPPSPPGPPQILPPIPVAVATSYCSTTYEEAFVHPPAACVPCTSAEQCSPGRGCWAVVLCWENTRCGDRTSRICNAAPPNTPPRPPLPPAGPPMSPPPALPPPPSKPPAIPSPSPPSPWPPGSDMPNPQIGYYVWSWSTGSDGPVCQIVSPFPVFFTCPLHTHPPFHMSLRSCSTAAQLPPTSHRTGSRSCSILCRLALNLMFLAAQRCLFCGILWLRHCPRSACSHWAS